MADHNRIAVDQRNLGPKAEAEPVQSTKDLEVPGIGNKIHSYRQEFRNFKLHNPDIQTYAQFQAAMKRIAVEPEIARHPAESPYYINPARQYTAVFDQKVLVAEKAAAAALQIFEEKSVPKLLSTLRNLDAETIRVVSELYKDELKLDFASNLSKHLKVSEPERQHIETLIKGDKAHSIASEINLILSETPPSMERLKSAVQGLEPKLFEEVKVILKNNYEKDLPKALNPEEMKIQDLVELIKVAERDPSKFMEALRKMPPEDLKLIPDALKRIEGDVPQEIIKMAWAFSEGNRALAEAIYIHREIQANSLSAIKVTDALENLTKEERVQFSEIYRQTYEKNPYNEIKTLMADKPSDLRAIKEVLDQSKIAESSKIYILANEAEKNRNHADNLIKILEQKTAAEANQIRQEIYRTYNVSLDSQLTNNLQGKDQLLGRIALYGRPETLEDELIRRKAIYDFERLNKPIITEKVIKELTRKGKYLDEELEKLDEQHKEMEKSKDQLTEGNELAYYCRLGFFDKRAETYGKAKEHYNKLLEYVVSAFSSLISYLMTQEFFQSHLISTICASVVFFSAKQICKSYIKKSLSTEKALQNFKERKRKRKKSHRTRSQRTR